MIRSQFPQIGHKTNGHEIYYFDSAATTLKHKNVVMATERYYQEECANVHRGIHTLSEISTDRYEQTREKLHHFINSQGREEIIFTKGTTESINLVAKSWGESNLGPGDEIIISHMEHHSNIVPWQMLCEKTGALLKIIPITDKGDIDLDAYTNLLSTKTKIVSCVWASNTLGTINPIEKMISMAHEKGAVFLVDAAQASSHIKIDVQKLQCDFLALSAHKMFGPTGVGLLYGKKDILNQMPPLFGGGDMIDTVTFEKTTYNVLPQKFEAGTPNIAGVIAWAEAIDFIQATGVENIAEYEAELLAFATEELTQVPGLRIIGTSKNKVAVISFVIEDLHPHDIATLANKYHIAVRTGHHCTQPIMERMKVPATVRASFSVYNTQEEIIKLKEALIKITELFG